MRLHSFEAIFHEGYKTLEGRAVGRVLPQTADAAKELLAGLLNDVENEMTDIPYAPEQWASDGRLYPILEDNWEDLPDGRWVGRSRRHQTFVGANGAIEIKRRSDGHVEFAKPGADGKGVGS